MKRVRLLMKNGAVVEFAAEEFDLEASIADNKITGFGWQNPQQSGTPNLGWVDVREIVAVTVQEVEDTSTWFT